MKTEFMEIAGYLSGKQELPTGDKPQKFLLATHVQPDGDAIGSTFSLAHVLTYFGLDVRIYLPGGVPKYLAWLPCEWPVVQTLDALEGWVPDVVIIADCGDAVRTGAELSPLLAGDFTGFDAWQNLFSINIDHHYGNPEFGDCNWVEATWAATGLMVGTLAEHLEIPLVGNLGLSLYLTLASDTGNFSFGNTSAAAFHMASKIVGAGLKVAEFTASFENNWSIDRMHLWGEMMSSVTLHHEGRVACCLVTLELLQKYGLTKSDLEGFAAYLRRIKGVQVGMFIRQDAEVMCKISLRSMGGFNVQQVAAALGGGGHIAAAGAEVALTPEATKERVLSLIKFS